jgi:2-dehydropantoate 2-reductase
MRILMLGAGAIGGYFGGRLVQAGADVTFLVRDRRAAQLRDKGLVVRSPHGDFQVRPQWIVEADSRSPFDLVILTCKAFDLDGAIRAIHPAVGASSHVLPLLNGMAHLDRLAEAFGKQRVLGGSCAIPATLSPEGEVMQLNPLHRVVFGVLPGTGLDASLKVQALAESFARTPVDVMVAPDILLEMWEKFAGLATLAAMNCLMRGSVGEIMSTEQGAVLMGETYDACVRVAEAAGHAPREQSIAEYRSILLKPGSGLEASMLRDLDAGRATEAAHIVGDMLHRALAAGIGPAALPTAWCHLQVYEQRRLRRAVDQ